MEKIKEEMGKIGVPITFLITNNEDNKENIKKGFELVKTEVAKEAIKVQ